jgi:transcriptional regulator with XRE-family HTH domain
MRPDRSLYNLAERIYTARRGRKFNEADFAVAVGVSVETLKAWEDATLHPTKEEMRSLAKAVGCSETVLTNGGRGWGKFVDQLRPAPPTAPLPTPTPPLGRRSLPLPSPRPPKWRCRICGSYDGIHGFVPDLCERCVRGDE